MELEEVFTVHVKPEEPIALNNEDGDTVVMIPFTGDVTGKYFEGTILSGGIDTQIIAKQGVSHTLSARYMLEGKDFTGAPCKVFIENNGNIFKKTEHALFRTHPRMITNSKALAFLAQTPLIGEGIPTENGLDIKIYRAV